MDNDFFADPSINNDNDWLNAPLGDVETKDTTKVEPKIDDEYVRKLVDKEIERRAPAPVAPVVEKDTYEDDLNEVLTRVIGNDTPERKQAILDMKRMFLEGQDRAKRNTQREIEEARNHELQEEQRVSRQIDGYFEDISRKYGVDLAREDNKQERSSFLDFVKKISPKDDEGQITNLPNLAEVFEVYKANNNNNRAREVASRSMTSTPAKTQPENRTLSFREIDSLLDKMTK